MVLEKAIIAKAAELFGKTTDPVVDKKLNVLNSLEYKNWFANELSKTLT